MDYSVRTIVVETPEQRRSTNLYGGIESSTFDPKTVAYYELKSKTLPDAYRLINRLSRHVVKPRDLEKRLMKAPDYKLS